MLIAALDLTLSSTPSRAATPSADPGHPIVLAHFYIWFDANSWNRAKIDFPLVGRYSSDQASVMRQQIKEAKSAGIDGFIVSWKSTPTLDHRLAQLVAIAREENFKLGITYQTRDFGKNPLPAPRISHDLADFEERYAGDAVFDIFGKPLVVLSGTWQFSTADIKQIAEPLRSKLLIVASERSAADYARVAPYVGGDLYYWASVNPETMQGYQQKLVDLGNAVRSYGGVWIAPAAPGFDARLIGGQSAVDRRGSATLRAEWQAALSSLPNAIGIISWNEFSENTYIEPSQKYGTTALDTVRDLAGAAGPSGELDSSTPDGGGSSVPPIAIVSGTALVFVACIVTLVRRGWRARS
jgi:hypothetical protein